MNGNKMIVWNEPAAEGICFSLPGALSIIPVRFSFPAPELNFTSWFTVSAEVHSEWLFVPERIGHIFISVAGLIRTACRKICRVGFCIRKINVQRARIQKLSYAGRRL